MIEIKVMTYEESRREYFEEQMRKAQRRIKYWDARIDRSRPHNMKDPAAMNAADAGWEYNFYKDALEALEIQQKWISVAEKLPEQNTAVIGSFDDGHVFQVLYAYDGWDLWEGCTSKITHWMPLPDAPKEE